jgi:hypothetical protein
MLELFAKKDIIAVSVVATLHSTALPPTKNFWDKHTYRVTLSILNFLSVQKVIKLQSQEPILYRVGLLNVSNALKKSVLTTNMEQENVDSVSPMCVHNVSVPKFLVIHS